MTLHVGAAKASVGAVLLLMVSGEVSRLVDSGVSNVILEQIRSTGNDPLASLLSAAVLNKAGDGSALVPEEVDVVTKVLTLLNDTQNSSVSKAITAGNKKVSDACGNESASGNACGMGANSVTEDIDSLNGTLAGLRAGHLDCRKRLGELIHANNSATEAYNDFINHLKSGDHDSPTNCAVPQGMVSVDAFEAGLKEKIAKAADNQKTFRELREQLQHASEVISGKPNQCADAQRSFEEGYCDYYNAVNVASKYDNQCRESSKKTCDETIGKVKAQFKDMESNSKASTLAICYLRALKVNDPTSLPAKVEQCKNEFKQASPANYEVTVPPSLFQSAGGMFGQKPLPPAIDSPEFAEKEYGSLPPEAPAGPVKGSCSKTTTVSALASALANSATTSAPQAGVVSQAPQASPAAAIATATKVALPATGAVGAGSTIWDN